ncbi:MAG: hypothetical protein LBK59_01725 [Bifidobacteriaceae bacterium]|jgi:hypothetical protein|nr:hypothetical protein [Bifidobacteriaceae bacterium]
MAVLPTARDHGVADADMFHAVMLAIAVFDQDDGMVMYIGPARSGALLEVGTCERDDVTIVPHAMPARGKYLDRLRKPR